MSHHLIRLMLKVVDLLVVSDREQIRVRSLPDGSVTLAL